MRRTSWSLLTERWDVWRFYDEKMYSQSRPPWKSVRERMITLLCYYFQFESNDKSIIASEKRFWTKLRIIICSFSLRLRKKRSFQILLKHLHVRPFVIHLQTFNTTTTTTRENGYVDNLMKTFRDFSIRLTTNYVLRKRKNVWNKIPTEHAKYLRV